MQLTESKLKRLEKEQMQWIYRRATWSDGKCKVCLSNIKRGTNYFSKKNNTDKRRHLQCHQFIGEELLVLINSLNTKDHQCRFNDGDQNCECYLQAINDIKGKVL